MEFLKKLFGRKRSSTTRADILRDLGFKIRDLRSDDERQMEREAYAGLSLGPEIDHIVDELTRIGSIDGFLSMQPGGRFNENRRHIRAREIGEELNKMGGLDLMKKVAYRVKSRLGSGLCGELERAWGYIGEWR